MIVKPHRVKSREVTNNDIARVLEDAVKMFEFINSKPECVALAHSQIEDKDPLRFYVTRAGQIFLNPNIEKHSSYTVESPEGCMTFPGEKEVIKNRWRKVVLSFHQFDKNDKSILGNRHEVDLTGLPAFIAQHEIDHLDGIYCYDKEN